MIDKNAVNQSITDFLSQHTDLFLIDLNISADNRIVVEIDAFAGVSIEICESLSRYIEKNLDRDTEDYELEVGSAGLTTPFKILQQYIKYTGKDVEVLTKDGKKLSGILKEAAENSFSIIIEKKVKPEGAKRKIIVFEEITLNYQDIKSTKYILKM